MAQAEIQETLAVDKYKLFGTIVRYEEYPKFVDGCTAVEVERKSKSQARVTYHVNLLKEISYTLDLTENAEQGTVEWTLVSSDFMKKNSGRWELKALGAGKTEAKYTVEIEFKIPVPGLILNRLVKGSLPSMIRGFEKQAQLG
jgi:ribosome-associated toxin RatA of RatAB toxin-antitoxin module